MSMHNSNPGRAKIFRTRLD